MDVLVNFREVSSQKVYIMAKFQVRYREDYVRTIEPIMSGPFKSQKCKSPYYLMKLEDKMMKAFGLLRGKYSRLMR